MSQITDPISNQHLKIRIASMNQPQLHKKCFTSVLYVSFVILLFQGIVNTELGIVSQFTSQKGQRWVGPLSTALLFLGSGLGALYNKYIEKMQYRLSFFFGSLGYSLFIALAVVFLKLEFTTAVQVFILVGSFVSGVVVSMFYNSQFNYVNTCSQIDKQETKYFGMSMCITQSANILGNFVSALLIQPVGQFNYALIMNISIFIVSLMFLGVRNHKYQRKQVSQDEQTTKNIETKLANPEAQINGSQTDIQEGFQLIRPQPSKQRIPYRIYLAFSFSGLIISFVFCQMSIIYYDTFQNDYETQEELNRITFVAFIIEGAGQFLGGFSVVFGQEFINRKIGIERTFILSNSLYLLSLLTIYLGSNFKSLVVMDIGSFVVGFCDCLTFTLGLTIAGKWREKGITMFNIGQSWTVAASAVIIAFVQFEYVAGLTFLMFGLSTYAVMTYEKAHNIEKNGLASKQ